jgi:hypothetical protein
MKRCASCGCPEIDHEGLSCRGLRFGHIGCPCRGFEDPDLQDAFLPGWPDDPKIPFEFGEAMAEPSREAGRLVS